MLLLKQVNIFTSSLNPLAIEPPCESKCHLIKCAAGAKCVFNPRTCESKCKWVVVLNENSLL